MKTSPGRPRSRYRNEAVFQSAQRLLSSPAPLPRPSSPAPSFSRARAFVLFLAAAALFATGIFVGLRWRDAAPDELSASARPAEASPDSASAESASADALAPAAPSSDDTPKDPASTTRQSKRPRPGGDPVAPSPAENAAPAPPSALAPTPARGGASILSAGDAATSTLVLTPVVLGAEVTIRGQLTSPSAPPLDFEFSLRRTNDSLTGVVRYLTPNGKRIVANTVKGEIAEGRHVELRETGTAWTVSGTSPKFLREFRPHRSFAFKLPAQADAKDVFPGYWSSYIQHDPASGDLTLWFAAPW